MKKLELVGSKAAPFYVEDCALEGVKKIVEKVCHDVELVSGKRPACISPSGQTETEAVLVMTLGHSELVQMLSGNGKLDTKKIDNKRECYIFSLVERPLEGLEQALIICGSDKRGTIYGLFHLSELIGVTPFVYWGDVKPKRRNCIYINEDVNMVSREPSVKYRGFFINDEWPCFGSWAVEHFGGFNAEMYDHVFEFLLRLKGNYLWPAMWSSSFALDGPGLANAELADLYGVIIGNSHHEPCLRASEEWDFYKEKDTDYGTEWNYRTNREGLLRYWEDGLKRSGGYENIITIGMRGERDSSMLGENSTLGENIALLKDIIIQQRRLIAKHVNPELKKVPQLLALYKEVEAYFYGDEETEGLKDWEELDGVTFMLCEDNFGNMRTLPKKEWRKREGGWGMYYHLDYHGSPISYEWVNSTPLTKIWDQMTMAYEYGIRDIWIVNVGDLKFEEFPLGYFMELAYDFERWGTAHPNQTKAYTAEWIGRQFGDFAGESEQSELAWVLEEYVRLNGYRRPEALNASVYHPVHYMESDRMLERAEKLEERAMQLLRFLPQECQNAYYSMIYYPAMASANLLKMHLYAAKNAIYGKQGRNGTNMLADKVRACICRDKELSMKFSSLLDGKWKGMEKAKHVGFTHWNDEDYRYPIRYMLDPADEPRLVVTKKDETAHYTSGYFKEVMEIKDFLSYGKEQLTLEIINGGSGSFLWHLEGKCDWLTFSAVNGTVGDQMEVILTLHREQIIIEEGEEEAVVSADFKITAGTETVFFRVYARKISLCKIPEGTFLESDNGFVIEANHYAYKKDTEAGYYIELEDFGKYGIGMKASPVTEVFEEGQEPSLTYRLWVENAGAYILELHTAPGNPVTIDASVLRCRITVNNESEILLNSIHSGYQAGNPACEEWARGVLENEHVSETVVNLKKGLNLITFCVVDAPLTLERLILYQEGRKPAEAYFGPMESYLTEG
ncbi:glycosyl hydrolase 115 family protein [Eisenbergiella porci]|jgi:hypothetical protein|uniref:glycosyl hydrolase 115 family protein n=1 Tax=Eisenbergiella porci TaxID=2652274 RepID=UPI002A81C7AD|nr:glycosyl hydrolase 115 family protein [Eisenbergiella porci]